MAEYQGMLVYALFGVVAAAVGCADGENAGAAAVGTGGMATGAPDNTEVEATAGTGGEASGNASTEPVASFVGSACKKEAPAPSSAGAAEQALITGISSEALAGLKCVVWEPAGTDGLRIDLVNFEGACGARWNGKAAVTADGSLELRVDNPGCWVAACGWCIYDWSFEVRKIGIISPQPLTITIDTCPGEREIETYQATLPVASSPQGAFCRYANWYALDWQAGPTKTCGTLNMPCLGTGMFCPATALGCNAGLVCDTNGTAEQYVCLQPCTADADCPAGGVLSCQAGFCRPTQSW